MNAYDHTDIISVDGEESQVEVNFKCRQSGGKEYIVSLGATVYMDVMEEEGDHLHPTFVDSEVKEIRIDETIISDIEYNATPMFNTPITEEFLKDQIRDYCI